MTAISTQLQHFLWDDREEDFYEVARADNHGRPYRQGAVSKTQAYESLRNGASYFAPIPKITEGSKTADCALSANTLWADIDLDHGTSSGTAYRHASELINAKLPGFDPSAVVYSGNRGVHLYWKLSEDLPIEKIELTTKRLALLLSGDPTVCERNRLMRCPGTINVKSGNKCELLDLSGTIYSTSTLDTLDLPTIAPQQHSTAHDPGEAKSDEWQTAAEAIDGWEPPHAIRTSTLTPEMRRYMKNVGVTAPEFRSGSYEYRSRSEMEQAITYRLVAQAASDAQLIALANANFSKHRQERADGRGYQYLMRTIDSARRRMYDNGWITSREGGWPKKRDVKYRHTTNNQRDLAVAEARGQHQSEWVKSVMARTGKSQPTVSHMKTKLIKNGRLHLDDQSRIHAI